LLKRCLVFPVLIIASSFAFVACGSSGNSDEDQIVEAIETSATSGDPANCTKLATLAFVEQSESEEGQAAVKQCEKNANDPSTIADSVAVTKVEVDGSDATADVAFKGSGLDGQTVAVALIKDGDQWKLDRINGFVKLDQAKLAEVFATKFAESSNEISPGLASCIVEAIEEASQAEVEELLLSGSSEPIEELAESCS
jgi:hypothetical protein